VAVGWVREQSSSVSRVRLAATNLLVVGFVASGCAGWPGGARAPAASLPPGQAVVVEVVDGDTIELDLGGRRERVRLLGIDAPESVHPSVPVQCYGPEASLQLTSLLPPSTVVRVERDAELRDRYDRLLLYVYRVEDGLFVNRWLLAMGLADTSYYEPNTALSSPLITARAEARAAGRGLWGHCDGPDQPLQ